MNSGGIAGVVRLGRDELLVDDLVGDRREVVGREGLLPREELVEDDAEREEVAPAVDRVPRDLLGRHVVRRPEELSRRREVRLLGLGDPEVGDLHLALGRDDDVRRLHVPVDDAAAVGVVERLGDLADDLGDTFERERGLLDEELLDVLPLDVLHRDERRFRGGILPDVVNRHDVRVGEDARGLRLPQEALLELALLDVVFAHRADRLERHETADDRVAAQVDDAHGALPQLANHLVAAEPLRKARGGRTGNARQMSSRTRLRQ